MITPEILYAYIGHLLRFPDARICRHAVAADLLELLEMEGGQILDAAFVKAVVDADDETALRLLGEQRTT